jgi:hypothetical protein
MLIPQAEQVFFVKVKLLIPIQHNVSAGQKRPLLLKDVPDIPPIPSKTDFGALF